MKKHIDKTNHKHCVMCGKTFHRDTRNTYKYWEKAKFCSRYCSGKYGGILRKSKIPDIKTHFYTRVDVRGEDDCWNWNGAIDRDGYGSFAYDGKQHRANRMALELDGRKPRKGYHACHTCDNPSCVNPRHLYEGSNLQNSRDKIERGRQPVGEAIHSSKLTEDQVVAIRSDSRRNDVIADEFGVSPSNIYMIKARKTWKHV